MAVYQVPQQLKDIWDTSKQSLIDILASATMQPYPEDRLSMFTPAQALGNLASQAQQGIPQGLADLLMQGSPEQAMSEGISGLVGPMQISLNYRDAAAIQELRRLMAEENRARGPMVQVEVPNWKGATQRVLQGEEGLIYENAPDPLDQILRGSWFHGMRPEARHKLAESLSDSQKDNIINLVSQGDPLLGTNYGLSLSAANQYSLPGSTHATPSYVRFGEPYGTSITASPAIAQKFSADENIHRVMPLYGGPPTERIIPMWRPEGVKAMNEGYNEAFNQILPEKTIFTKEGKWEGLSGPQTIPYENNLLNEIANWVNIRKGDTDIEKLMQFALGGASSFSKNRELAEKFNILYSKALQDKGYRGILYSPQRYGEYEMLMLDPSFVKPLDYRAGSDYVIPLEKRAGSPPWYINGKLSPAAPWITEKAKATPKAIQGYQKAKPEFESGTSRLSDVFNQMPWIDRINQENKMALLQFIDPKYRETVGNMLMRR